ncbi:MAG: DUF4349 domain-containing protein [Clostridia bacterium]|nr:DUF4349 domain-containing protein [Clostridia bacterium]
MKKIMSLSIILILVLSLASCGVMSKATADSYYNGGAMAEDSMTMAPAEKYEPEFEYDGVLGDVNSSTGSTGSTDANRPDTGGRKVIFSSSFSINTKNFTESCAKLEALIAKFGGYVESSRIYSGDEYKYRTRSANYTIRVPASSYFDMINETPTVGTVVDRSDNNRDITDEYFDIEARLSTLETKQDRLLALLAEAKYIDDIISLNNALEETMYQIENLTGTLKKYDSLISYSTVTVSITEVAEIVETPPVNATFGERISNALSTSWKAVVAFFENAVIVIVASLPMLLPLGAIALIVIIIVAIIRGGKKRRAKKMNTENK